MKIVQDKPEFKPLTLILETREEVEALMLIVDDFDYNSPAKELLTRISNAFTDMTIVI